MRRLRVLIPVDHAVGVSGPHRHVVGTLNALGARTDVDVVLLTGRIDSTEPYANAPNIEVHLGFAPHSWKRIPVNLWRVQAAARGCDVVYVPSGLKPFLYAQTVRFARRLIAGPNVTPLPIGNRDDAPGKLELRWMSDAWFEASRARRNHVRRVSGNPDVFYIHHAIDTAKFSPTHRDSRLWASLGLPQESVKILFVGRDNERRKGVPQLLHAIEILNRRGYDRTQYILAGKMSKSTMERIRHMENVTAIGFKTGDELAATYASADMSIVPSSWENFPFVVLEAQASGIPVIGSNGGGIPEIIEDGETGIVVDIARQGRHREDSGEIIAAAIARLVDDPELRARLGGNARNRVLTHFSEARLGDDLMAVFTGERSMDQHSEAEP